MNKLNLTRPICFFDLETTGVDIVSDRIVEIAILKIFPDSKRLSKSWLVNPIINIPDEASQIHGITNDKVSQSPTFKEISNKIFEFIKNCDLAGFNSDRFDIPLLAEEFLRSNIDFDYKKFKTIDVQTIFHKMEKRTLGAALKFYCEKELVDAHSAMADSIATFEVLIAQINKYEDLPNNVNDLSDFSSRNNSADVAGFLVYNENNQVCFSFGKHKNKPVEEILEKEPGYFGWLLNADFPLYTKKILSSIRLSKFNNK